MTPTAKKILKKFVDLAHKLGKWPSRTDLLKSGITRDMVRYYFGNFSNLKQKSLKFDKSLKKLDIFTDLLLNEQKKAMAGYKKFVVTTAVAGAPVHKVFYASLKQYCKENKAKLLVIPSNYQLYEIDPFISKDPENIIVFRPLHLNSNVAVHPIKIDPKQIDPTIGLEAISKQLKTIIVGSPKQRRRSVANGSRLATIIQSTGSVTKPAYMPRDGVPKRRDTLATTHHVMGAIVVEIENKEIFHFRNIQMSPNGTFCDLFKRYTPEGSRPEKASALVLGDYHVTETDPVVDKVTDKIVIEAKPKYVIFHDFFSGVSINHHEEDNFILMARKAQKKQLSLEEEIKENVKVIKQKLKQYPQDTKLVFVKSNHDEFLNKFLYSGNFPPINRALALELSIVLINGEDPLIYAYKKYGLSDSDLKRIKFLKRDEDFRVGEVFLGAHGDIGVNGSRNPGAKGMYKAYGNCVFGHTHTAEIWHGAMSVGTSSYLKLGYNVGASSWIHAHAVIYDDGTKQLINIVDGQYTINK